MLSSCKAERSVRFTHGAPMKLCQQCNGEITGRRINFCSSKCRYTFSNRLRPSRNKVGTCGFCNTPITKGKFCSTTCAKAERNQKYLDIAALDDNSRSPRVYKRYLISLHGNKCMQCGWGEINLTSNTVPVELEHIDGNHKNNKLENLKLLCPNCHSLTPTYKNLNKGNGRFSRMERYNKGLSS